MECNTIKDTLDAYILGALEEQQSEQVKKHIQNCQSCQKYHEESMRSWQKLQSLPVVSPSISYADVILQNERRGRRILKWGFAAVFMILALAIFMLFGLFFLIDQKEQPNYHIAHLEKIIWRFYGKHKRFPKSLRELTPNFFPQKTSFKRNQSSDILDLWGTPYLYRSPGKYNVTFFDLYSRGKNKKDDVGYHDDIRNWK